MSDADISLEIFSLDDVIRKLYQLPTAEHNGEYISSNRIMFDILKYINAQENMSLSNVSLESIGMAIDRVFSSKVRQRRAIDNGMKTTRYLLIRVNRLV